MDLVRKEHIGASVDSELKAQFKALCKEQGFKMSEILESLMQGYVNGEIRYERKAVYGRRWRK